MAARPVSSVQVLFFSPTGSTRRIVEAIADYDQAIALFPDSPDKATAYNSRGVARSALGQHEEAIADYGQAITLNPEYASAHYNSACAYALIAGPEQALPYLRRALALRTEHYCRLTAEDTDFDSVRDEPAFQALIEEFCSP